MSHTEVTLIFIVDTGKVQHFIESMTKAAYDLEDAYRCPAVEPVQDMRCELPRDHDEDRHQHGTLSWPKEVAGSKVSPQLPNIGETFWNLDGMPFRVVDVIGPDHTDRRWWVALVPGGYDDTSTRRSLRTVDEFWSEFTNKPPW